MRRSLRLPFLSPLLLLALASCNQGDGTASAQDMAGTLKRQESARVRVKPVVRQEMWRALETTTVVESERAVMIQPLTTGMVVELLAEEGDTVKQDQVLARLDQRDAQAQLDDAKIALQEAKDAAAKGEIAKRDAEGMIAKTRLTKDQATRDFERNNEARMISAIEIERLKLAMETAGQDLDAAILARDSAEIDLRTQATAISRAQLAVDRAAVTMSYTELRAPFEGVLTMRGVQVGDNVSSATEAFHITDLNNLRTVFLRPQRELGLFTGVGRTQEDDATLGFENIEVTAESEALPGVEFKGHIERISPNIDALSGSFRVTVRLEVESEGFRLLPGMLLRLRLITERHPDALTVSKRSLRREGEATILFVAEDGAARRVQVDEGFSGDDYVEVTPREGQALEVGMDVVVVGNRDLEDGKPIEVSSWDDEPVTANDEETATAEAATEEGEEPTSTEDSTPPGEDRASEEATTAGEDESKSN